MIKRIAKYILRDYILSLKEEHTEELKNIRRNVDRLRDSNLHLEQKLAMTPRAEVKYTHRLTREAFDDLKRKLQENIVTSSTTDVQAGFLVGQQRVLDILERGYVSG